MIDTTPQNTLINVQTWQSSELAALRNQSWLLENSNKRFNNFQTTSGNLGDTVTYDLPPRSRTTPSLIPTPQPSVQRIQSLTVANAVSDTIQYSSTEMLFNVQTYLDKFLKSKGLEMGTVIEGDLLNLICSNFRCTNSSDSRSGQILDYTSGPYRFYDATSQGVTSIQELAQITANFQAYGAVLTDTKGVLPNQSLPQIIGNQMSLFTPIVNDGLILDWTLGKYAGVEWGKSNLLPKFVAGICGQQNITLTVVRTNDLTGSNITQLVCSGAPANTEFAIRQADHLEILNGVSGVPDVNFVTFTGRVPTSLPVQFRSTSDAVSDEDGNVTFNIYPALVSAQNINTNITHNIVPNMKIKVLPSYTGALLMSGNPLYVAMPKLGTVSPFQSSYVQDDTTGIGMRSYWGRDLQRAIDIFVNDAIYGGTLSADYCMLIAFPYNLI